MIGLIFGFILFLIVCTILYVGGNYLLSMVELPKPIKTCILLLLLLIVLALFFNYASSLTSFALPRGRFF